MADDELDDVPADGELVPMDPPPPARTSQGIGTASTAQPNINVNIGISATYASQLPPADEVERLEAILPGTLDRLIHLQEHVADQADAEQSHRHEMERQESRRLNRGQLFAGGAFTLALVVALILALTGNGDVAKILVGSTLAVVVVVFVTGRIWGGRGGEGEDASG